MLATGLTLKNIPCGKYGTLDKYVPDGDYVVIKFARWAFEKFKGVEDKLGTQMRAVGEVMSIGKNYKEAFQKAIRSLETGRYGLGHAKDFDQKSKEELLKMLVTASSERISSCMKLFAKVRLWRNYVADQRETLLYRTDERAGRRGRSSDPE